MPQTGKVIVSAQSEMTAKTQAESQFATRRYRLDDPFTSLLPVSEWLQTPYEIEFFKNIALKDKDQLF